MRFVAGLGFDESTPWLTRKRQAALVILMVAVVVSVTWLRYTTGWTPLQRQYLPAYFRTGLPLLGGGEIDVLVVVDGKQTRWALDDDVTPGLTKDNTTSFVLSSEADHPAAAHLEWRRNQAPAATIHGWLRQWIYGNQTLGDLAIPSLRAAFEVGLMFVIVLLSRDLADAEKASIGPWKHSSDTTTRPTGARPPVHADVRSSPFFY